MNTRLIFQTRPNMMTLVNVRATTAKSAAEFEAICEGSREHLVVLGGRAVAKLAPVDTQGVELSGFTAGTLRSHGQFELDI